MTIKKALLFIVYVIISLGFLFVLLKGFFTFDSALDTQKSASSKIQKVADSEKTDLEKIIFTSVSNVTVDNIFNLSYPSRGEESEFVFLNGENQTDKCLEIKSYSFGDLNKDGSGDALVLIGNSNTEACVTSSFKDVLYTVLNMNGILKVKQVDISFSHNKDFLYKTFDIEDGTVLFKVSLDGGISFKDEYLVLKDGIFVPVKDMVNLKTYQNAEFGFRLKHPENVFLKEREIIENGKNIKGSLVVSLDLPFLEKNNIWDSKNFSLFVRPGVCPVRNDAQRITRNNIDFYVYDPEKVTTSDLILTKKIREYMTYKTPNCFIFVSTIGGLGPKNEKFPKPETLTVPENEELFLKFEMVSLEQIFDTFSFIK